MIWRRRVDLPGTLWNELLAGSMMAAIVPILLLLPFQRYYVRAITSSGLKE